MLMPPPPTRCHLVSARSWRACGSAANKLLATRLDAIVTADLTTGRDEARAKRKELVALAESLIELTEQQIKRIDALKAGEPAAAVEATAEANAPATAFEQLVGPRKVW